MILDSLKLTVLMFCMKWEESLMNDWEWPTNGLSLSASNLANPYDGEVIVLTIGLSGQPYLCIFWEIIDAWYDRIFMDDILFYNVIQRWVLDSFG